MKLMKSMMFRFFLVSCFTIGILSSICADEGSTNRLINSITQDALRKQIRFNYDQGNIQDIAALREMVDRANAQSRYDRLVRDNLGYKDDFSERMKKIALGIKSIDKEAVKNIELIEKVKSKAKYLFAKLEGSIAASYKNTLDLIKKFNPKSKTNDNHRLSKDIDDYLESIQSHPAIKYALKVTNTTIVDLKKNWFGNGLGFEHVFAGELKGSKVSGYHWWYTFYTDERRGWAKYTKTLEGYGDPHIFTGSFSWDPDGKNGPLKNAYKRKGGFLIGNSAAALLALGHVAIELGKKAGKNSAFTFPADINGGEYIWQMYLMNGSIRSLFPMVPHRLENSVYERLADYDDECGQVK